MIVDVRDSAEVAQTGKAAGAVHIPRGSLEFKADLDVAHRREELGVRQAGDPALRLRRARGARRQAAQGMGYEKVYNLGGFKDWVEAGGKVDK